MRLEYTSFKDWCTEHQGHGWDYGDQEDIYFFDYNKTDRMLMLSGADGTAYYADGSEFEGRGLSVIDLYHIVGFDKNPSPIKIGGE